MRYATSRHAALAVNESIRQRDSQPLRHDSGRRIVSERLVASLSAVAEAVFTTETGPPDPERMQWLARELEDFLARSGARTRFLLGLASFAVAIAAPLFAGRLPPLRRLPLRERARALALMEDSRFGAPVLAVKALLCVLYYEHPAAAESVGFDGACLTGARRALELGP